MAAEGETGRTDCALGFFLSSFIRRKPMGRLVHIYIYTFTESKWVLCCFFFPLLFFFKALLGTLDLRNKKVISLSLSL